ncbi:MAG: cold-shock protein [Nanoarchaeales archaeon]|nr:cold-shock protein [Nanoarchaeales archaeon]
MEGKIKFFNKVKGFGFIIPSDGSKDIFVHSEFVAEGIELREDTKVTFDIKESDKGPAAINVELSESSESSESTE